MGVWRALPTKCGVPGAPWGSKGRRLVLPRSPKKFFKSSSTHAPLGLPGAPFERGSWNSSKFLLNFFKNDRFHAGTGSPAGPPVDGQKRCFLFFPPWGPLGLPGAPWGWNSSKFPLNFFKNDRFDAGSWSRPGPGPVPKKLLKSCFPPLGPPGAPWGSLGLPGAGILQNSL